MGVELAPRRAPNERWTYARMKADLARFVGDRDDWPPRREFYAAGLSRLYCAIRAKQGHESLAAELGLGLPPGRIYGRTRWTDEAIRMALDTFLEGHDSWPTQDEFKEAGLGTLPRLLPSPAPVTNGPDATACPLAGATRDGAGPTRQSGVR
jgi:hypothetical protein